MAFRLFLVTALVTILFVMSSTVAFAHHCILDPKPDEAGLAAYIANGGTAGFEWHDGNVVFKHPATENESMPAGAHGSAAWTMAP